MKRREQSPAGSVALGARLRAMRERRLWTVRDLAHSTGLHRSTLYRAEAGSMRLRRATLQRIVDALSDDDPDALADLVKLAGKALVSDGDYRRAARRERRRDERRDCSQDLERWRRVWSKLGVRVMASR